LIVAICGLKRRQQTREIVKIGENEDVMALKGTQDELVCQKPKGYLPTDARLTVSHNLFFYLIPLFSFIVSLMEFFLLFALICIQNVFFTIHVYLLTSRKF
jgi:hypothetical protein